MPSRYLEVNDQIRLNDSIGCWLDRSEESASGRANDRWFYRTWYHDAGKGRPPSLWLISSVSLSSSRFWISWCHWPPLPVSRMHLSVLDHVYTSPVNHSRVLLVPWPPKISKHYSRNGCKHPSDIVSSEKSTNFFCRYESGCPKLIGSFTYSRKRNVVELEIKQDTTVKGSKKFLVSIISTRHYAWWSRFRLINVFRVH